VRNLIALGVNRRNAIITGVTKLGHWKMSKTPGVNQALSKRYLDVKKRFKMRHPSSLQSAPPERGVFHGFSTLAAQA
jgi:hypothetical protein